MISREIDFEGIEWKETPYEGIFVSCLDEEDPAKATAHAVRIDPGCEIGLHYHDREDSWTEFIVFPLGGDIEVRGPNGSDVFSGPNPVYLRVNPREVYGIRNRDPDSPLFSFSIIKPGFTGYREIVSL